MRRGFETPVGPIWVEAEAGAVVRLGWGQGPEPGRDHVFLEEAEAQLLAYFAGELRAFDLPVRPAVSDAVARVLQEMQRIPYGETRTYGDLARAVDLPAQAVGQACGANPIPILIPCHRVLGAQGLGGYSGAGGVETKVALLKLEGAAGLLL